jgi:hypothetical protein
MVWRYRKFGPTHRTTRNITLDVNLFLTAPEMDHGTNQGFETHWTFILHDMNFEKI